MKWILVGERGTELNRMVGEWARKMIGAQHGWRDFSTISMWEDGALLCAILYEGYCGNSINMHVAAVGGKRWMNRRILFAAFDYPFNQLKVDRVTGLVPDSNEAAKRFDEHLGFVREGVLRRGADDGSDLIVYGMLREECRHLESPHGQRLGAERA